MAVNWQLDGFSRQLVDSCTIAKRCSGSEGWFRVTRCSLQAPGVGKEYDPICVTAPPSPCRS